MWAMLGNFDEHEVMRWNPTVGAALLWLYVVVAQIILVNLLIAMMGDTYRLLKERADEVHSPSAKKSRYAPSYD